MTDNLKMDEKNLINAAQEVKMLKEVLNDISSKDKLKSVNMEKLLTTEVSNKSAPTIKLEPIKLSKDLPNDIDKKQEYFPKLIKAEKCETSDKTQKFEKTNESIKMDTLLMKVDAIKPLVNQTMVNEEKSEKKEFSEKSEKSESANDNEESSLPVFDSKDVKFMEKEIEEMEQLSSAKLCRDEINFERYGLRFQRQTVDTTKRCFVYQAKAIATSTPIVCKVIVMDFCSPRLKDNIMTQSNRIIRYVGGNGKEPEKHPAFIRLFEIFQIESKLYIFMEKIDNNKKNILTMIKNHKRFNHSEQQRILNPIIDAVGFLHARGIAHRSLKMEHILMGDERGPKICGWSRAVIYWNAEKHTVVNQNKETRSLENYFLPMEAFNGPYNPAQADIWSLGVLLAALATRRYVFNVKSKVCFSKQWADFLKKHNVDPKAVNILNGIFKIVPNQRSSLKEILSKINDDNPPTQIGSPSEKKSTAPKTPPQTVHKSESAANDESSDEESESSEKSEKSKSKKPKTPQKLFEMQAIRSKTVDKEKSKDNKKPDIDPSGISTVTANQSEDEFEESDENDELNKSNIEETKSNEQSNVDKAKIGKEKSVPEKTNNTELAKKTNEVKLK